MLGTCFILYAVLLDILEKSRHCCIVAAFDQDRLLELLADLQTMGSDSLLPPASYIRISGGVVRIGTGR